MYRLAYTFLSVYTVFMTIGCGKTINYKLLGERISEWRTALSVTQEELSYMTGISAPYISMIERGKKKPSLVTVTAIADALGVTVDELMAGNQLSNSNDYLSDFDFLLSDCTVKEKRFMYEILKSMKKAIRNT